MSKTKSRRSKVLNFNPCCHSWPLPMTPIFLLGLHFLWPWLPAWWLSPNSLAGQCSLSPSLPSPCQLMATANGCHCVFNQIWKQREMPQGSLEFQTYFTLLPFLEATPSLPDNQAPFSTCWSTGMRVQKPPQSSCNLRFAKIFALSLVEKSSQEPGPLLQLTIVLRRYETQSNYEDHWPLDKKIDPFFQLYGSQDHVF